MMTVEELFGKEFAVLDREANIVIVDREMANEWYDLKFFSLKDYLPYQIFKDSNGQSFIELEDNESGEKFSYPLKIE